MNPIEHCQGSIGNCQFCSLKEDCILLNILNELKQLNSSKDSQATVSAYR